MGNIIKASDLTVAQIQDGIIIYDPDTKDYNNNVIKWLVIGKNQDGNNTITIQSLSVIGDGAFGGGTGNRRYDKDPYKTDLSAEIQTWLDTDCFDRFSYNFKEKTIPVTKEIVPYGIGGDVSSKECKLFNLSVAEIGGGDEMYDPEPNSFTYYYFQNINSSSANTKRVRTGNFNGDWHLRSPSKSEDPRGRNLHLKYVAADGSLGVNNPSFTAIGPAPGCVLSDEIWLEEDDEGDYLISYTEPKESYQKLYAYHEKSDGNYELKSYWTSSETVEFEDGQTLEQYKPTLETKLNTKADEIDYSLDEGEVYLLSNGNTISTEDMRIRVRPNVKLDDIFNLTYNLNENQVTLSWEDPDDILFSDFPILSWAGTKVVRKIGSAPDDVNDGTVILNSTTRNAYSSTPYVDTLSTSGVYYYYRFFPYDTEGNYYGESVIALYKKQELIAIPIPVIADDYEYTGEQITPTFINYDSSKMTISGDTSGTEAGLYSTNFTPKEGYKWTDNTTETKTIDWEIYIESYPDVTGYGSYVHGSLCVVTKGNEVHLLGGEGGTLTTAHIMWNGTEWNTVSTLPMPFTHRYGAVLYDNEIHIFNGKTSGYYNKHYKWNGSEWIELGQIPEATNSTSYYAKYVVCNNKIHLLGNGANQNFHYEWDPVAGWIQLENCPLQVSYYTSVLCIEDTIYVFGFSNCSNYIYKWDAINGWQRDIRLLSDVIIGSGSPIYYNNEIHFLNDNVHYKYSNDSWIQASTPIQNIRGGAVTVRKNKILAIGSNGYVSQKFCAWNGSTWKD